MLNEKPFFCPKIDVRPRHAAALAKRFEALTPKTRLMFDVVFQALVVETRSDGWRFRQFIRCTELVKELGKNQLSPYDRKKLKLMAAGELLIKFVIPLGPTYEYWVAGGRTSFKNYERPPVRMWYGAHDEHAYGLPAPLASIFVGLLADKPSWARYPSKALEALPAFVEPPAAWLDGAGYERPAPRPRGLLDRLRGRF